MPFSLALASLFFFLFGFATGGITSLYYVFIFFCGVFLGAPYIIVSSQIAAYLGRNPMIKGKIQLILFYSVMHTSNNYMPLKSKELH